MTLCIKKEIRMPSSISHTETDTEAGTWFAFSTFYSAVDLTFSSPVSSTPPLFHCVLSFSGNVSSQASISTGLLLFISSLFSPRLSPYTRRSHPPLLHLSLLHFPSLIPSLLFLSGTPFSSFHILHFFFSLCFMLMDFGFSFQSCPSNWEPLMMLRMRRFRMSTTLHKFFAWIMRIWRANSRFIYTQMAIRILFTRLPGSSLASMQVRVTFSRILERVASALKIRIRHTSFSFRYHVIRCEARYGSYPILFGFSFLLFFFSFEQLAIR